jgi:hypothetical protein
MKRSTAVAVGAWLASLPFGACGSEQEKEQEYLGKPTGDPCTLDTECIAGGVCLTNESFTQLTDGSVTEIPGGYCSKIACRKNLGEEECGPGAYCFNLQAYVCEPLGVCGKLCSDESECRDGYECTDGSNHGVEALPQKACLPPGLFELVAGETCTDAATPEPSGDAGSDAPADVSGE